MDNQILPDQFIANEDWKLITKHKRGCYCTRCREIIRVGDHCYMSKESERTSYKIFWHSTYLCVKCAMKYQREWNASMDRAKGIIK